MAMTCEECEKWKRQPNHKVKLRLVSYEDLTKTILRQRIVENGEIGEVVMVGSNTRGPKSRGIDV